MKVISWKPGLDENYDAREGTVAETSSPNGENVETCPCCGAKLLIRRNKIIDIEEDSHEG